MRLFSKMALERLGAHVEEAGVAYRVWAPGHKTVDVVIDPSGSARRLSLSSDEKGYWTGSDPLGRNGDLYHFRLDDGPPLPDVASRFQPQGVHGPSECINPATFQWCTDSWKRPAWDGQTIYEIHVGTLTTAGTFQAAIDVLDHIRKLGAEAIELMPLADFAGTRNWGYDGVALFAPAHCYGRPDDLRSLVDAAHQRGLAVILDVVYNHVGPQGNYLGSYNPDYFTKEAATPWGTGFHLDSDKSLPVRTFLATNAAYWLDEFRIDGLRLDATHAIADKSTPHILEEISDLVHARGGFLIAEDERNSPEILRLRDGSGYGMDAAWADDFHHQIRVALTGIQTSYFSSYSGSPSDVADTLEHGWTFRGQPFPGWNGRQRGSSCDHLPTQAFVVCIENHDQVGNRPIGERLEHLVTPAQFRAASMLLCLSPYAVMLFMGQEWSASTPFLFFTNHEGPLGQDVTAGRRQEFEKFHVGIAAESVPDPEALATFQASKLKWSEIGDPSHAGILNLYRECLNERRNALAGASRDRSGWRAHAFGSIVSLKYSLATGERLLLVSLQAGRVTADGLPDFLRPANQSTWRLKLHSEFSRFGGAYEADGAEPWVLEGPGAVWLET